MRILEGEILEPGRESDHARRAKRSPWSSLKRVARQLPFAEDMVAAYYCAVDPATNPRVRGILLGALAVFVLPFGLGPRLLARVGLVDTVSALAVAIATVSTHITPAHREAARRTLADW